MSRDTAPHLPTTRRIDGGAAALAVALRVLDILRPSLQLPKELPNRNRPTLKTGLGLLVIPSLGALLAGCTATPTVTRVPTPTRPLSSAAPLPAPTPLQGPTVAISGCCTATIPIAWSAVQIVNNGLSGSSDPSGRLNVSWHVVGSSRHCPSEPAALVDSLTSPSHPSGEVITGVNQLMVSGRHATVYITAPTNPAQHHYQYLNADVVIGAECVDLGGAEYGAASAINLRTILQILATTEPIASSVQPAKPR
jgi:hypothetical protein